MDTSLEAEIAVVKNNSVIIMNNLIFFILLEIINELLVYDTL